MSRAARWEDKGDESFLVCWMRDGEIPRQALIWNARRVLLWAARRRTRFQLLHLREIDGRIRQTLKIHNISGGGIRLSPEDAGTRLGADLILAIESLGAGRKVQIGEPE